MLLDAIERFSAGRWLTIGYSTLVSDLRPCLVERGYDFQGRSHATLMARALSDGSARGTAALQSVVADPRFSCQRSDVF